MAFARAVSDQSRGGWVAPDNGRVTLAEYAMKWLDTRLTSRGEHLRPKTRDLYESCLRLHILPPLGALPLGRLNTATVRSWHSSLLAKGCGRPLAAKCYRLLRTILGTAMEDGLVVANPCSIKGAGVEPTNERELPTLAEVFAIADAISPQFRAMVLLAAFGGLRRGELRVLLPVLESHLARWAGPGQDGLIFPGARGGPCGSVSGSGSGREPGTPLAWTMSTCTT
ncbi:MAG TPA: hypothetical protein VM142_03485 [Acidimicrobiales bacterium]|nr:hypothetical protein [Acidimicrobiales bacterium]